MIADLAELVNPSHSAVLVIDLQNDFCHSEGISAKAGRDISLAQKAAYNTETFLKEARNRKVPIVFVRVIHSQWNNSPVWLRQKQLAPTPMKCQEGSWGAEFFVIKPLAGDPVVTKHRYSAFIGTNLDLILRSLGIQTLIVTGVGTPVCVESTVRDGFQMDYHIVVLSDCTGTSTVGEHSRTLERISMNFGTVAIAKDLIEAWAK